MVNVCYIEKTPSGLVPPPGYKVWEVSGEGAPRGRGWFSKKPEPQRLIAYKESCAISLEELEVVCFVLGETATGYLCSCDLALRIVDPESLLAQLGSGEWVVTDETLQQWLAPRVTEALKDAGESQELEHRATWPNVCGEIQRVLPTPAGTKLESFTIRQACRFEKRIEEVRLLQWWRTELAKAARDGRIARAIQEQREAELLQELGEERARSLLSHQERDKGSMDRLESYFQILGLRDLAKELRETFNRWDPVLRKQETEIRELLANCFTLGSQLAGAAAALDCPQRDTLVSGACHFVKVLDLQSVRIPGPRSLDQFVQDLQSIRDEITRKYGKGAASAWALAIYLTLAPCTEDPVRAVTNAKNQIQHLPLPTRDAARLVDLLTELESAAAVPGGLAQHGDIFGKVLEVLMGGA